MTLSASLESPLSPLPAMATERRGHTATRLADGRVLIAGGENTSGALNETEIYDPATSTFSISGNLSTARVDHSATLLADGRVLIAGGRNGAGSTPTTELFDPTTGTFSSGPAMSVARAGHSATLFADGRILIVGGDANGTTEIFDGTSGSFTALGEHLGIPRSMHSAALLLDGRVVIVGGHDANGSELKSVEIFDTPASTFSTVDDELTVARVHAHLRVLFDGKVQIIGGSDDGSMEIYDPLSESIGAYAHVLPETDTCPGLKPGVLASQTRAALFHNGQTDALLDRTGHTITELNGQALVVGGSNSSGAVLSSSEILTSSGASITTDKLDYAPGETATFTGRGFLAGETVRIAIHEDPHTPQERNFQVVADADGNILGAYLVQEYDLSMKFIAGAKGLTSNSTAQTTFTDSRTVTNATLNGGTSVTVSPGDTISAEVFVTTDNGGGNSNWRSTGWLISATPPGSVTCQNTPNHDGAGSYSETFSITAPATPGTYNAYLIAYSNDTCSQQASNTFVLTNAVTVTGTNSVTFDATPIGDVPSGTTVLSVTIGAGSPTAVTRGELPKTFTGIASGTNVSYSYVSPITQSATKQYRWLSTSGPTTTQSGSFTLSSNTNVSATYQAQFLQTFTHSGLTADATGTVVTVDAAAKTFGDLAFSKFVDSGSTVTYSFNDPVTSSVTGKQYRRTSVTGPANGYTVSSANTITGNYVAQFLQTFQQSGLTADASGTVVTVDSSAKTFADLAFSKYVDSGSTVSYSYTNPVTSSVTGKQYRLDSTTGPATGYTVSAANTITGNYVAQYKLSLAVTAGVPGGIGNITGGTNNTFYDDGTVLNLTATTPVADGPGKQWRFDNWTGDVPSPPNTSNPVAITMSAARSVTANYVAQYQLTLAVTAGVPGGTTNITGGTSGNFHDTGTVLNLTAASPVADGATKQWRFDNWTGDVASPPNSTNPVSVTMNQARSITANYVAQYLQTFTHTGLVADATGTVVSVDSVNKSFGDLPFDKFVDSGATVSYTFTNPVTSSVSGKQYRLDSVSGAASGYTVSSANTISGNYVTQYKLTLAITAGVPSGLSNISGGTTNTYYDAGTVLNLSATTPVADGPGKQWRFANWTGDLTTSPDSTNPVSVTMNQARSITANYIEQYELTLAITAGVPGGLTNITGGTTGTFYDAGTSLSLTAASPVADGPSKQWRFDNWTGDVASPPNTTNPVSVIMNQARSITANYVDQFLQTFAQSGLAGDATGTVVTVDGDGKALANLPFTKFVDNGSTVSYSFNNPVTSSVSGKQYRLDSVTGPATGYTVSGANTVTGNYVPQYQLTLAITAGVPSGLSNISGGSNGTYYDDGTNLSLSANATVTETATKRWRFTNWTGDVTASPNSSNPVSVTMDQPRSITANYVVQWLISFTQTGIGSDTGSNTVATVSSNAKAKGDLPYSEWFDNGSTINYSYEAFVNTSPASTKRYRRDSVSGIASGSTVTAASTITGNYVTQWKLTFAQSGIGSDTGSNIVVTVSGNAKSMAVLPYEEWFDDGATVTYGYEALVNTSPSSTKRYRRDSVSGIASGTAVHAGGTITGNYVVQWQLTFTATGIPIGGGSVTGTNTVVTVNAAAKTAGQLAFSEWYDNGTNVSYVYSTPISTDPVSSTQYELSNAGSLPASPINVTSAQTITGDYSVNTYTIHYLTPIDESNSSTYRLNTGKNGRVIPVKVQIYKNGVPVETGTVLMRVMGSNCTADDGNSLVEEYADAGSSNGNTNLFRWNAGTPGFWIYNLDTRALGLATNNCYRLDVYLNGYTGPTAIKLSTSVFALFKPVK